jgi:hypothetical protein
MPKKQVRNLLLKNLDDYIMVTDQNKKMALEIGSWFYIIKKKGNAYEICGTGCVRPRLRKGKWYIDNYPLGQASISFDMYSPEEESQEAYMDSEWSIIFKYIKDQNLYIRKTNRNKTNWTLK